MRRQRIQWLAIGFPAAMVGIFEFMRHRWLEALLPGLWGNILGALLVAATVYGFIRYFIGAVTRAEQDLGRSRAEAAVLAERHRIGREMHDSLAQSLFHLRVRLEEVQRLSAEAGNAELRELAVQLQDQVTVAYDQVRKIISDLKKAGAGEDPAEAIRREAVRVSGELGLTLQMTVSGIPPVPPSGMHHLLSVVSEALTNAWRHGNASDAYIALSDACLSIEDNGKGFDHGRPVAGGFGLMIMEERARILEAGLDIQSEPGKGTRIHLHWGGRRNGGAASDRR